ncbi:MAG: hypothetical protein PHE51_03495 [Eubacteriales bacterium]|nr:hypothetical protein [Eubacteriales bacterium]
MTNIIMAIVIIAIWAIRKISLEYKVNNYPNDRTDCYKMSYDKNMNNLSYTQVKRNMVNGKYDKR